MAQDKTLESNVHKNLVSVNYLHSNKFNFINSVNATNQIKNISSQTSLGKAEASLQSLYNKATELEKAFYEDMEVSGALEFSQKYLLFPKNSEDSEISDEDTDYKIIFSVLNSMNFKDKLEKLVNYKAIQKKIVEKAGGDITKFTAAKTREDVLSTVSILLEKSGLLDSREKQEKFFSDAIEDVPKKILRSAESKYFKDFIKASAATSLKGTRKLIRKNSKIITEFSNEIQKKGISKEKAEEYKVILTKEMNNAIERGDFSSSSQVVGWVLEVSFNFSQLNAEVIANGIDQKDLYKLTDKNYKKTVDVKSKSDVIFTGKSGAKYPIQLKNTKNEYGNHFMINLQSKINLDTLLGTIVKSNVIDRATANEIGYLLTNILFLKDNGLNMKNRKQKLSTQEVVNTRNYVNSLLNGCLDYFLGSYLKKQNEDIEVTKGNLFFIYQGKYLIPISLFFNSALSIIDSLKKNQQGGRIEGSFGSMRIPTLENFESSENINAKAMKQEKMDEIANLPKGEKNYPDSLREIGGNYGQAALKGINLKGAYFYINTATLEELLRNIK